MSADRCRAAGFHRFVMGMPGCIVCDEPAPDLEPTVVYDGRPSPPCGSEPWQSLTRAEAKLAAYLLRRAREVFANHGCNDVDLAALGLTADEMREVDRAYHAWNGDPNEHEPDRRVQPDFALMAWLASRIDGRRS